MKTEEKSAIETWLVLEHLKEDILLSNNNDQEIAHEVEKPKTPNYPSVQRQVYILGELQRLGAIKINRKDFSSVKNALAAIALEDLHIKPNGSYSKGIWFERLSKFNEIYNEYSRYAGKKLNTPVGEYWITKENGKYFFNGKLVHFKSKGGKYLKIFDAVFSLIPEGGSITYKEIQNECGENKDSVLRALCGKSSTLHIQAPSIPYTPAHGVPLFEPDRKNSRLIFNNDK